MQRKLAFPLMTVLLTAGLLSTRPAAYANTISLALTNSLEYGSPGSTLAFFATATAGGANAANVFLNSDSFSVSGPLTLDDTGYLLDFPLLLAPGQSFTGELFTVSIPNGASVGAYTGFFDLIGGPNDLSTDVLASAPFTAVVPEPSGVLLFGAGIAGIAAAIRLRRNILAR